MINNNMNEIEFENALKVLKKSNIFNKIALSMRNAWKLWAKDNKDKIDNLVYKSYKILKEFLQAENISDSDKIEFIKKWAFEQSKNKKIRVYIRIEEYERKFEFERPIPEAEKLNEWRNRLLDMHGKACQECGNSNELEAHHIKSKYNFPELMYDINNGKILCFDCHIKTDNYGSKVFNSTDI